MSPVCLFCFHKSTQFHFGNSFTQPHSFVCFRYVVLVISSIIAMCGDTNFLSTMCPLPLTRLPLLLLKDTLPSTSVSTTSWACEYERLQIEKRERPDLMPACIRHGHWSRERREEIMINKRLEQGTKIAHTILQFSVPMIYQ